MTISFQPQKPIVCPNASVRYPPVEALPFEWIKSNLENGLSVISFDGYVVRFIDRKVTALFMKKEFMYDNVAEVTEENLIKTLTENGLGINWVERLQISEILNIPLFLLCWPLNYPHSTHPTIHNPVFIFQIVFSDSVPVIKKIKRCSLNELQDFIFSYRRFRFTIVKPLLTAKSYMECYLSTTPSPWPGDLDGIILETNTKKISALLEFKTHNLSSDIEQESVNKYAIQDMRRFKVLNYLQKEIGLKQGFDPPIIFIIWGTGPYHKKIKIQKISNGQVIEETYIESPKFSNNYKKFTNEVVSYFKRKNNITQNDAK